MALKSTIFKARLQLADIDRGIYRDDALTLARHPSETDERMMMRLLAFALQCPADDDDGALAFARGLSDTDEPDLWRHTLDGRLAHWIEVGQPDERRLLRAASRAERVTIYAYAASTPLWWDGVRAKVARAPRLAVWQLPSAHSQALAALAARSMHLQLTAQDGHVWVTDGQRSVELQPQLLKGAAA